VVESSIKRWGTSSFVVEHRLMKGEVFAVECLETRVWVAQPDGNLGKFEARPIPSEVKARFSAVAEGE